MYKIEVGVVHALGTFTGFLGYSGALESCQARILSMQRDINILSKLVIVTEEGTDIVFNKDILSDSILIFAVREVK